MELSKLAAQLDPEVPIARLAVLIDADNAPASTIGGVLDKVALLGEIAVKRVYGDFTSPASASFKTILQKHAIKPVQQFAYTSGKNATDGMLFIDAMDLLYTKKFDGFCLVSSDSDFTSLAIRIREEGLKVYGFGEKKTPKAFQMACHSFIFTESMRSEGIQDKPVNKPKKIDQVLLEALKMSSDNNGWASLGVFGSRLSQLQPDFDLKEYGHTKLSDFISSKPNLFKMKKLTNSAGKGGVISLRAK